MTILNSDFHVHLSVELGFSIPMGGCVHQQEGVKKTNIAFIILIFTLLGIIVEFYRNCVCGFLKFVGIMIMIYTFC